MFLFQRLVLLPEDAPSEPGMASAVASDQRPPRRRLRVTHQPSDGRAAASDAGAEEDR